MIALVVFQSDMLRVLAFELFKEDVQGGTKIIVILLDLPGTDHLHDHGEILLIRGRFVMQIEHQRQQEHGRCLVPEWVLALAALWRGILK